MKSQLLPIIITTVTIVGAAASLLFLTRQANVGKTTTAFAHLEEDQPSLIANRQLGQTNSTPPRLQFIHQDNARLDPNNEQPNRMDLATKEVLQNSSFASFCSSIALPVDKKAEIATILALSRLNIASAMQSENDEARTILPTRIQNDAYNQISIRLSKEHREALVQAQIIETLLQIDSQP